MHLVDIIIAYYQKTVILLHTYLCLPYSAGDKDSIYADFSFKTGFMIEMNTYHLEIIKGDFFLGIQEKGLLLCVIFLSFINLQNMLVKHLMRIL